MAIQHDLPAGGGISRRPVEGGREAIVASSAAGSREEHGGCQPPHLHHLDAVVLERHVADTRAGRGDDAAHLHLVAVLCVLPSTVKRTTPASSLWNPYAVSYSSPAGRAAAIGSNAAVQQSAAGCGSAALCDDDQDRDEDESRGIKPIVVCAHADIFAVLGHPRISELQGFVADEIDEAGEVLPQLGADRLVGQLAGRIENITGPRNL